MKSLTFPTVLGRIYTFESSTDLVMWEPIFPGSVIGTGNPATFDFGGASEFDRLFIRAHVRP